MTNSTEYDLGAIRRLLIEAFTAPELRRFCREHPKFRPVVASFGADDNVDDMADKVTGYCERNLLFPALLEGINGPNPLGTSSI